MGPHRQTLLDHLATVVTVLRGEARVDSYHLMTSSFSLFFKDVEKCTPTGVHNGFGHMVIVHHIGDLEVFDGNRMIGISVLLGRLEMEITALTFDLQMGLRCALRGFARPQAPFLASAQRALLAP